MSDPTYPLRKRRYRERLKTDCLFAVADVPARFVVRLIELGYLSDGSSMDARARGEALVKYALAARVSGAS